MRISESRSILVNAIVGRASNSSKSAIKLVRAHEEIVAAESGIVKEYLNTYVPKLELQVKGLEEFVAGLEGKYVTDVDPMKSRITDIRKNYVQINLKELLFGSREQATKPADEV